MKKLFVSILVATLFLYSGKAQVKEKRDVDEFTVVSFGVSGDAFVKHGDKFSVTLEGDQDLLDEITTTVKEGKLVIRKPNWRKARNKRLTAYITMPEIEGLKVSGSGDMVTEGAIESDELSLGISGSGTIKIDRLSADELSAGISGSGNIKLDGQGCDKAKISISGSGNFDAEGFKMDAARVGISGSGRCTVWVEGSLIAKISGSGNLYYKGDPNVDAKSSGSGKIKSL